MIPTQDPKYTATRLIRSAKKAGKPIPVWIGVNARARDRMLVAREDGSGLVQAGPRVKLIVSPDMNPDTLAASLAAKWAELQPQIPSHYPKTQQQRFNPGVRA